ncbi:VOC family protein [Sinomonas terrae]|uniref:VOC family protein n=1 Tax=Sinomonas terrae TaxID=2908838 RepID=A0ABS9TW43_9MICC|nr:VOC family protein [Sinomonas terrae]MCH6468643.1 VOC family protein [Sinomonas terrae]
MEHEAKVTSTVVFVRDLERSAEFYTSVFGCRKTLDADGGALLLAPGGFQIYLVAKGEDAPHPLEGIGAQYLMWAVDTPEGLQQFEASLKSASLYSDTHSSGGVTFVEGRDPDGIRVVIAHPSPLQQPRSSLDNRIYS